MKCVDVLMSTYNGAEYVQAQLKSILEQDYPNVRIYIRDDGSSDSTFDICKQFTLRHNNIHLLKGENIGFCKSFMELLATSDSDAGYYAFCDQDDFWFINKLSRAVNALEKEGDYSPALYFCRVGIANQDLKLIRYSKIPRFINLQSALVENVAQGSTIVINKAARDILISKIPADLLLHDWWCYLVISALGKVVYDPQPSMYYRMHTNNVSYGAFGWYRKVIGRTKRVLGLNGDYVFRQAQHLLDTYEMYLPEKNKESIQRFNELSKQPLFKRSKILCNNRYRRQNLIDEIMFRIFVVLRNAFFM